MKKNIHHTTTDVRDVLKERESRVSNSRNVEINVDWCPAVLARDDESMETSWFDNG